jgi:pyruvate oxidase
MVGTDHHQEVDLYTLFKDVAAFNEVVWRPEQLPRLAALAIRTALGRGAPVHPSLPLDVATETVPGGRRPSLHRPRARMTPCDDDLDRAAELLDRAERPVILAGAGCRDARGSLVALAERIGAPIVRTLRAKDVIPDAHPLCLGGLGLLGTRPAWKAMRGTDPLLMVGTDFPYLDFFPDRVPAIQIEVDDARLGRRYPVDVGLLGHANPTMRALTPRLRARRGEWLEEVRGWMEDWERQLEDEETSTDVPLRPQTVARRLAIWPPTTRSSWPTPGR